MVDWAGWKKRFEERQTRPWPTLSEAGVAEEVRTRLAVSLARFQLGETGEGRVANQLRNTSLAGGSPEYADCVRLLIAEEGRHARILGAVVRALGGETIRSHWTDNLFTTGRRLIGVRTKLLVLFVSEVVGIAYYETLAEHFPDAAFREVFREVSNDERLHFDFHVCFFQEEFGGRPQMLMVKGGLVAVASLAGLLMVWDHRHAFPALGVSPVSVLGRMRVLVQSALQRLSSVGPEVAANIARHESELAAVSRFTVSQGADEDAARLGGQCRRAGLPRGARRNRPPHWARGV